ncbi:pyrroline-5-carboxylate reductase [Psychrobium sp. 1_MG-2023]|uniref:pyrroline-5-carboxylate reductase n=1 Tax=Psychrobium sp. 1_MG-2023 TaxID=3062624 RepID=UPI000C342774|nr:pyrroline-5-carboxylate reductase [Psychrobium sp. 1_MG-2023]MDP2562371.1 pyrroline-5-carboxylate reductase [Psychrobium sp. 1_MG-2023]PKF55863.1 pyrroline-5-carboxylate reductase [Alteromonadales bacterium alter-6D02]
MEQQKIAFIGAGNMSRSIISGLVTQHYPGSLIMAANPSQDKLDKLQQDFGILTTNNNDEAVAWADIVVLAVKPQIMAKVCQDITNDALADKLFITIAAGILSERYQAYFNHPIRLVRCMPNTPSLLGLGMSGLYAGSAINQDDRAISEQIIRSVGEILWVDEETHIDTVIACSGSSPAYFFLFMEYMQQSAVSMGLSGEEARLLIQQSALGAAQMVRHNNHLELSELRKQVTSKGGTTHAAIETFKQQKLDETVDKAMKNAVERAQEMASQF